MIRRYGVTIAAVMFVLCGHAEAATRYAKVAATGLGDCTSWANACVLGDPFFAGTALAVAASGDAIWVQAGTYPPFSMKSGVKLFGGFAGTETLASQSNPTSNPTIIDGGGTFRCVTAEDLAQPVVLRGFTLRNGYADDYGGGLFLGDVDATVVQCIFEHNTADFVGGAVMVYYDTTVRFINCIFRYNGSTDPDDPPYGGGALVLMEYTSLTGGCPIHS